MTQQEHTAGPWFFSPEHRPNHYGCNIAAETGENIATVHNGENDNKETIANARLIAAAPELLEALDRIEAKLESRHMEGGELWFLTINAIAKARRKS